jgi:glutamine synthetase
MNDTPVQQSPRQVLKNQIARAAEMGPGYHMKTGVECEFFLLKKSSEIEIADSKDDADKPCYEQGALMRHYTVISELLEYMETLGWEPYQADHEDANGQFELNWAYDDCLKTADRHTFFKFMTKTVAEKHGFRATFMPKPFVDKTGNGAHCHVSVWKDINSPWSTNLFDAPLSPSTTTDNNNDHSNQALGLSVLGDQFMAGVLHNAQALVALLNPTVNSYKRIDGRTTTSGSPWAPFTVSYAGNNRTHLLRIPDGGRFELRLADGAVNPYLLQAATLASGLHGIRENLPIPPRCDWNGLFPPPNIPALPTLPSTLLEALQNLDNSAVFREALGNDFIDSYLFVQRQQWRSYTSHLSKWELDNTLDC